MWFRPNLPPLRGATFVNEYVAHHYLQARIREHNRKVKRRLFGLAVAVVLMILGAMGWWLL